MFLNDNIRIIEKPEIVSWNDIQEILWRAHERNRSQGIIMGHQNLSGEEIRELIGNDGIMFLAMHDDKCIGTAAVKFKEASFWFGRTKCAYRCFESVIPEYQGLGIYKKFTEQIESFSSDRGIEVMMLNTHPKNVRVIEISKRVGYRIVKYSSSGKYKYVYLVKWLKGCPYSQSRCSYEYLKTKILSKTKHTIKSILIRL